MSAPEPRRMVASAGGGCGGAQTSRGPREQRVQVELEPTWSSSSPSVLTPLLQTEP